MKIIFLALSVMLSAGLAAQKQDKDPEISAYVKLVSKDSLKANVEKLVSFGTRHTMSSTTDDRKGIGAARNWVLSKFRNYAQNAGGRMEVFLQNEDLEPDGKRINKATNLGNAIAILKGTQIGYVSSLSPWDYAAGKIMMELLGMLTCGADQKPLSFKGREFFIGATQAAMQEIQAFDEEKN